MFTCQNLIVVRSATFSGLKVEKIGGKEDGDQMQITKKRLKQIIEEEMNNIQNEGVTRDEMRFLLRLPEEQMRVLLAVLESPDHMEQLKMILKNKLGMSGMLGGMYTGGSRYQGTFEE